jgi:hypothetical protein
MAIDFADDSRGIQLRLLALREQYQRGVMSQADALLDREFGRLLDLILSARYRDLTIAQRQRAAELFREIGTRLGHGYRDLETHVVSEMKGYATLEADVSRAQVVGAFGGEVTVSLGPALPAAYVESIAKLPIQGLRIGEWFDAQARTMTLEAKRIIQQGLVEGKGPAEIAGASWPTAAPPVRCSPAGRRTRPRSSPARSRTRSRTMPRMASYERLPASVSDSYVWRSVRDNRVSTICAALDGRVWRYDDPARRVPPAHPQCRSVVQALLKGAETTLTDQKGPVTMRDYGAWLMAQPIGVQNEILGATRAGLWRSGKMHLSDAIDAGARVLTLRELRAKIGLGSTAAK